MFKGNAFSWNPYKYQGKIRSTFKEAKILLVFIGHGNNSSGIFSINKISRFYHFLRGKDLYYVAKIGNARMKSLPKAYRSYFSSTILNLSGAIHLFGMKKTAYGPGIAGSYGQISANVGENITSLGKFNYLTFGPAVHFCSHFQRKRFYLLESARMSWGIWKSHYFEYPPSLFQFEILLLIYPRSNPLKFAISASYSHLIYQMCERNGSEKLVGKGKDSMLEFSIGVGF